MKKWIVGILVGGLVAGAATMAFAVDNTPVKDNGDQRPPMKREQRDSRDLKERADRLLGLFERYLPEELDTYEDLLESRMELKETEKELRESIREAYEEEFAEAKEAERDLFAEWKAKVAAGEAMFMEAEEAMNEWKQETVDEIVGVDEATRAALDDIRDQVKAELEEGKEIRKALPIAVKWEDEAAIQDMLQSILDEMETVQELNQQRLDLWPSV